MRATLTIDDDVYEAVQAHARASGKRTGEVVSMLIRRALGTPVILTDVDDGTGLPVIKVRPGTPMIPGDLIPRILAEEVQ